MDKNKIKSFAIWARRNLINSVSDKANRIGISHDKICEVQEVQGGFKLEGTEEIFPLPKSHRDALVKEVKEKGFDQVMEEVAYTWFNRFMGLRYMEVNDYLPTRIRILSSEVQGKTEPDVLTNVSEIIDELELNGEEIYELLDSGETKDREKAYKIILVKQCNELGKIIPQMFEKISDYTELLIPDNLLEEGSVIRKMVSDIAEEDWKEEVEIIGWMYQYYISEKKDKVFADLKKNVKITKENIPAATQLFTPKWIVKYMVENSLGRLWLEGHPNEELQSTFKYYLEEAEQEPEVELELQKIREEHSRLTPEDIKVLDPCMGSGHILVYAFDVLYEIYKIAGYTEREIPKLILTNNLYGLDIDDRAAQLASFALIMKARQYNRRLFREIQREDLDLNLCSIQESNGVTIKVRNSKEENLEINEEVSKYFYTVNGKVDETLKNDFEYLINTFIDAKEYGSILEVKKVDFENLKNRLKEIEEDQNLMFGDYRNVLLEKLPPLIKQGEVMSRKYEVCVTNPPYMGNLSDRVQEYALKNYYIFRYDFYSIFISKALKLKKTNGFVALVTGNSWLTLSSYESLRRYILSNTTIQNLSGLGNNSFENGFGTVAYILRDKLYNYKATYLNLEFIKEKENMIIYKNWSNYNNIKFIHKNETFLSSIDCEILITATDKELVLFNQPSCETELIPKAGIVAGKNDLYLRLWSEVNFSNIALNSRKGSDVSTLNWVPLHKGGGFRRYYGIHEYIIRLNRIWKDRSINKSIRTGDQNFYFIEGLTWTTLSSKSKFGVRKSPAGFVYNTKGSLCFLKDETKLYYILGFLNSMVAERLINIIAPNIDYNSGTVVKIPFIYSENNNEVEKLSFENHEISKNDWDSFETSWDFVKHPFLKNLNNTNQNKISEAFSLWESSCEENFNQLKANEEELNRIFIDIYGLSDELTPEVLDKDVTIRKADRERDIKSFISYAVGCMFGRYSIDADGLVYAGGDFSDKWNFNENKVRKIEKDDEGNIKSNSCVNARFMCDRENIIPITEDEYFEDDIVSRFIEFVRVVYGSETLEENLDFIADSIGRKASETSRQAIRRYFIKDFYKDHLKIYQKRPIYWMLESGKNNGFKALVYMHRYNDQTIAKVRTDYLHTLQRKYEAQLNNLKLIVDSEEYSVKDRASAKKKIDKTNKQIEECREYDQVVSYLANEKISIDLDDGVKVNYAKFQDIKVINSKDKEVKMNLLAKI